MRRDAGEVWRGPGTNAVEGLAAPALILPWLLLVAGRRMVVREGMPATGTTDGSTFGRLLPFAFNLKDHLVFAAYLAGPNITADNDMGIWAFYNGQLQLVVRKGDVFSADPATGGDLRTVAGFSFFNQNFIATGGQDGYPIALGDNDQLVLTVNFTDGSSGVFKAYLQPNHAPTVSNPISDQAASLNLPWTYTFPAYTFADADVGQTLTYTTGPLPAGLSFDATSRTFSGTPTAMGTNAIMVIATDNGQPPMSATNAFQLVVNPTVSPINVTLKLSGTNYVKLSFATDSGNYYQARTATNLTGHASDWVNLGGIMRGAGTTLTLTYSISAPWQFFEVVGSNNPNDLQP